MLTLAATATLVNDYIAIYSDDPAIDREAPSHSETWDEYVKTGDFSKVVLKPGEEPAKWKLRHIRGKAKRMLQDFIRKTFVDDMISPTAAYVACQIAVLEVEGLVDVNGKIVEVAKTFDKDLGLHIATEESMQVLDLIDDGSAVNQIGVRAILQLSANPL